MTDKYMAYLELLANRDHMMNLLSIMAVSIVLAWYGSRSLPTNWYRSLRYLWLIGGIVLYVVTVLIVANINVEV